MLCGIRAYGKSFTFKSKKKFQEYLIDWIVKTERSERDRAVMALSNLREGYNFTDTDGGTRCR